MTEPNIINTLRNKRDDLERAIRAYEKQIQEARIAVAHVNATLRLFELNGETPQFPVHMGMSRVFKRGELWRLVTPALQAAPDGLDTRELAAVAIEAKGMDGTDKVLRQAVTLSLVHVLTMRAKRGQLTRLGKRKGVVLWNL